MINAIKTNLQSQPRNLCLFTLVINKAYRAGELLSLRISDVADLRVGDSLEIKQSKTNEYLCATLNRPSYEALQSRINVHPQPSPSSSLFLPGVVAQSVSLMSAHW